MILPWPQVFAQLDQPYAAMSIFYVVPPIARDTGDFLKYKMKILQYKMKILQ